MESGRKQLLDEGVPETDIVLKPSIDMRYRGQVNELVVPAFANGFLSEKDLLSICESFTAQYERIYGPGSSSELSDIECVSVRVDAIASTRFQHEPVKRTPAKMTPVPAEERMAYWGQDRWINSPVYREESLGPECTIEGPAILEFYATTIPLHPGHKIEVDSYLNVIISS